MDTNLILAIVGVSITIILGGAGIWYTKKYRRKVNLTFIYQECFSLFNTIVKNLDEIEIKFKGNQINENLFFLKGGFLNSGSSDLDKSNIHAPLKIVLPRYFEWKKVNVYVKHNEIKISKKLTKTQLSFNWDLLKINEFFSFDSLIEYTGTKKLSNDDLLKEKLKNGLKIDHRISNLGEVSKDTISFYSQSKQGRRNFRVLNFFLISVIFFGILAFGIKRYLNNYHISYLLQQNESTIQTYIELQHDKSVKLKDFKTNETISKGNIDEIFSKNVLIPTITKRNKKEDLVPILIVILSLVYLIYFKHIDVKEKKLLKQIEII